MCACALGCEGGGVGVVWLAYLACLLVCFKDGDTTSLQPFSVLQLLIALQLYTLSNCVQLYTLTTVRLYTLSTLGAVYS